MTRSPERVRALAARARALLRCILPRLRGRDFGVCCRIMRTLTTLMTTALLAIQLSGCGAGAVPPSVKFANVTPGAPQEITATLIRPTGEGPFPAVVQLHG